MISYDDTDGDGKLNVNEFYMAFSKLYSKYHLRSIIIYYERSIFGKSMTKTIYNYVNRMYSGYLIL